MAYYYSSLLRGLSRKVQYCGRQADGLSRTNLDKDGHLTCSLEQNLGSITVRT